MARALTELATASPVDAFVVVGATNPTCSEMPLGSRRLQPRSKGANPAATRNAINIVRVWRSAAQFDPARGTFGTWLAAITRHHLGRQLVRRGGEHRALAAASVAAALAQPVLPTVPRGRPRQGPWELTCRAC